MSPFTEQLLTTLGFDVPAFITINSIDLSEHELQVLILTKVDALGAGSGGTTVTPGGTGTEIQFRNGTTFAGIPGSSWDGTTLILPGLAFPAGTTLALTDVTLNNVTLNNATFTGGTFTNGTTNNQTHNRANTKNSAEIQQTLTDAATVSWDMDNGAWGVLTLGGNRTIANPTNTRNGSTYILELIQDATGSRTVTWGSNFVWSGGTAPTLTTTAGKRDIITFACSGGKLYGTAITNF